MKAFAAVSLFLAALAVAAPQPEGLLTESEAESLLEKRTGTIDVTAYGSLACNNPNQGTTTFGTSSKCANLSNAKSIKFHNSDSKNCDKIHAQYFTHTNCAIAAGTATYTAGNCYGLGNIAQHASAKFTCVN